MIIVSDEEKSANLGYFPLASASILTICSRLLENYSAENFSEKLSEINWFKVINCDDVDVAWSNFKDLFMSVVDKIAPLKEKGLKQRSEPWITSELLDDIPAIVQFKPLKLFWEIKLMKIINIFVTWETGSGTTQKGEIFLQQNFGMQEFIYRHMESYTISGFYQIKEQCKMNRFIIWRQTYFW